MFAKVILNIPIEGEFFYKVPSGLKIGFGFRVEVSFTKKICTAYVIEVVDHKVEIKSSSKIKRSESLSLFEEKEKHIKDEDGFLTIIRTLEDFPLFREEELKMARWLKSMYFCSLGQALALILPGEKRNKLGEYIPSYLNSFDQKNQDVIPSAEQLEAINGVYNSEESLFYLRGMTGSGKTKVYIELAKKFLEDNRSVIYLVPEISLTNQVIEEVKVNFASEHIVLMHSKISRKDRLKEWMRMLSLPKCIVLGVRSAIFAPVSNLGLIILDEENDPSYKSGSSPYYHARQVAFYRANLSNCKLIMGSATPSLEAYYSIKQGLLNEYRLSKRLSGGSLPKIEAIDMRKETHILSSKLLAEIYKNYKNGLQSLLFINKRGFSYFCHCKLCGYKFTCAKCSVGLTYYKDKAGLYCNHCSHFEKTPKICPSCSSTELGYLGFGTQKIEEEIKNNFNFLKVARVDSDFSKNKKEFDAVLKNFKIGEIDVLIGTQMVAKGFNFEKLSLVGVVSIDTLLNSTDFRSFERTFALVTQVAGRSGRFLQGGKVFIQSFVPDSKIINYILHNDLDSFYEDELESRQISFLPPFSRMIRIMSVSKSEEKAKSKLLKLKEFLTKKRIKDTVIMPLNKAPLSKINENYRYELILLCKNLKNIKTALLESDLSLLKVDLDPLDLF